MTTAERSLAVDTLLAVGLWNAVGATLLALVATAAGRLYRRPAVLHALWLLVLLKLLTPPLWSVDVPIPKPAPFPTKGEDIRAMLQQGTTLPVHQILSEWIFERPDEEAGAVDNRSATSVGPADIVGLEAEPLEPWRWPWLETVLAVWAGGALLCWSLSTWRILRFHGVLRRLSPAGQELQERARRVAATVGLRRTPVVYVVVAPISPMVWALTGRAGSWCCRLCGTG